MKNFFFLFFILLDFVLFAQHEADYWYFGNYAGLDFSSGKPEPLTDGQLKNYEGCATISDSLGNLLFYTNGVTVWNKNHQIMQNGEGLLGDTSATQSALIIPQPENDSIFYLFTTDELTVENESLVTDGLNYSVINIKKNNNKGEVILKNIHLLDSATEKITAIKHQNGKDIWIIAHEWGNNRYYTFLLDENGLSPPVISETGASIGNDQRLSIGYMKASPEGNKIVTAILGLSKWEIFDFDNLTGILSNKTELSVSGLWIAYACEFSPDGSKLYIASADSLLQADMNAGSQSDIQNSLTKTGKLKSIIGAIQNANNGKIYVTSDLSDSLSVINFPDSLPATCGFEKNAVYLDGRKARLGLPNFMQSYFKPAKFRAKNKCFGDTSVFTILNTNNIDSVMWNFGDEASGSENTSKLLNPKHRFTGYGVFEVSLTVWYSGYENIFKENIKIVPPPYLDLGKDTVICDTNSLTLSAYAPHLSYLWNILSTDSAVTVDTSGTYSVKIENIYTGCKNEDSIQVVFAETPEINLGEDREFCETRTYIIKAYHPGYTYTWQDGSHNPYFETDTGGVFTVKVKNAEGCPNSDTLVLTKLFLPRFDFGNDTVICEGDCFILNPGLENADYYWQDGSNDSVFCASETGKYYLTAKNICGVWSDSIFIGSKYCGDIYIPNIFTPNGDGINDVFIIKGIENEVWKLEIFNRWGNRVYLSLDYNNDWQGKDLKSGVYYYILTNTETKRLYKGTVRLLK